MGMFIDMHHHLLYGMDDGPVKIGQSKRMIDLAYEEDVRTIIATPHVLPGKREFKREQYEAQLEELNGYCQRKGYKMRILPGAELLYTDATVRLLREKKVPTMNGTRFVLVEWSHSVEYDVFVRAIRDLSNAGLVPIVAHIERYRNLWSKADALRELREGFPMRIQIDCGAIVKKHSFFQQHFVKKLLKEGLVDYVASDAHNTSDRSVCLLDAFDVLASKYGTDYARQLTQVNPQELIGDEET